MSQAPQFVISEFTNPSGEIVFRLTGWLDGKRIRKNFPTRAEAGAERQAMEIQRIPTHAGIRAKTADRKLSPTSRKTDACARFAGRSLTPAASR